MKFLDYSGLEHLVAEIKKKFVQRESGKGLSTNDFTSILKEKLEQIEAGAEKNTIKSVNGKLGEVVLKSEDIEFISAVVEASPTTIRGAIDKILLENKKQDKDIETKANKEDVFTKEEIEDLIQNIKSGVVSINGKTGEVILTGADMKVDGQEGSMTIKDFLSKLEEEITKNKDKIKEVDFSNKREIEDLQNKKAGITFVESELNKKVDKEEGKGLSSNDFSDSEKIKLRNMEERAEKNKINLIKKNGVNVPIIDASVDIEVPTKTSDIFNDKSYQTEKEVKVLIQEQGKIKKKIVEFLPQVSEAEDNTLYLIRNKQDSGYEEWMIVEDSWEILGDTAAVDFTGYLKEEDVGTISKEEIDAFLNN